MEPAQKIQSRLKDLCTSQKLAVVSTQSDGQPYASLVAFVASDDLRHIYFVTARTTRKFANLIREPRVAVLINSSANLDYLEAILGRGQGRNRRELPFNTCSRARFRNLKSTSLLCLVREFVKHF